MIGKIARVPLRSVWKHEAYDLTTWLQENIDVLNDVLDLDLSNPEREQSAGTFSIDIVAEDENGNPVIIENQLEKSNHDHLGKILTYLVSMGAKIGIWIVADPRPEHIAAITWLNESSSADFYLLKIEAIQIGDSPPAPLLTVIVGPSEEGKVVGKAKQEMAGRHIIRKKFWTQLLEHSKQKTTLHSKISPSKQPYIATSAGKQGLNLGYVITRNETRIELYIDRGKEKDDENKKIFDQLYSKKSEIEKEFGENLEWQKLDSKRACRICKTTKTDRYQDIEEKWPQIIAAMVESMIRFSKSLKPHIQKLRM